MSMWDAQMVEIAVVIVVELLAAAGIAWLVVALRKKVGVTK